MLRKPDERRSSAQPPNNQSQRGMGQNDVGGAGHQEKVDNEDIEEESLTGAPLALPIHSTGKPLA